MEIFNLIASDIKNLELKLEGKLPIDRNELFALVNSWGRCQWFYTKDKDNNSIKIKSYKENEKYDLSKLDVSKIKDFNSIFRYSNFNGDISSWNISNATSMAYMFANTQNFNQPLDKWNTSKVIDMGLMFYEAEKFNQNINLWNISNVIFLKSMFAYAKEFNQPLDNWNTSNVTSMYAMFCYATKFNQPLNSWNISKVINMEDMFFRTKDFNQPLLWDLSNVEYCNEMFFEAKAFIDKFNKGKIFPYETNEIKKWIKDNQELMIAMDIEYSKGKELDKFLLNLNNKGIQNGKI